MPDWNAEIGKLLAGLNLAPTREAEIVEELARHAEDRCRELERGGASAEEARRMTLEDLSGHQALARELRAIERADAPEPVVWGAKSRVSRARAGSMPPERQTKNPAAPRAPARRAMSTIPMRDRRAGLGACADGPSRSTSIGLSGCESSATSGNGAD